MQKLKSYFLSLFFFIAFSFLGLVVGVAVGYGILFLDVNGMFSSWELLNGDQQFEKIVSANPQKIWAQANDRNVYSWNTNCKKENCNKWVKTKESPEIIYETEKLEISASCKNDLVFQRDPPGNVIECAHVVVREADIGMEVNYALLENGEVWIWKISGDSIEFMVTPFFWGLFGIVASLIGFVFFMTNRVEKDKINPASTE
jgi:hypothetical protein